MRYLRKSTKVSSKPRYRRAHGNKSLSHRLESAPETARFLRRAAPAFFRELSKEYSRHTEPAPLKPDLRSWPDQGIHAAWLGHSTVLLKVDGFTILTDPVFSSRVGISLGPMTLGIKRLVEPAGLVPDLPHVDLIVLSHAHMDHFDLPSLRSLESSKTQVITAAQTADLLRVKRYANVQEVGWGERVRTGPATVSAFEVAHWGARMRSDTYRGFNAYDLEIGRHRIVFGGDTAYTDAFKALKSSKPVDLAIMPIGAYDPWIRVHCNPEQAWDMANHAGSEFILPVHHQTFQLSREPYFEPIERVLHAAGAHTDRIALRGIGGEFHLSK
jgi:L-ascorbate metabolism protein UlaG (beta-lactamase superfamily)